MPTVSAINSSTSAAYGTPTTKTTRLPQKALGQEDFLKLLATQFKVQDPLKPVEDTAFIAQMAQFSSLEQSSSMSKEMSLLRADQQRVVANSYLGHRVTVDIGDGQTSTGDVTAIDASGSEPKLVVGDKSFPISTVLRVEPAVTSPSAPQPATGAL